MTDEPTATTAEPVTKRDYGWPALAVAILFGIFYAYDLWEAISTLVLLPPVYEIAGLEVPWGLLITTLAVPPLVFAVAFIIGRRFSLIGKALVFLVGLTVVAGLSLSLVSLSALLVPA